MAPKLGVAIHQDAADLSESAINFSGAGDTTIIAGISGLLIRVYKIFFIVGAATNITYKNDGTALSGPLNFSANEGMVLDFDTKPWFTMARGSPFVLNSSNAVQVSGTVYYTQDF